MAEIPKGFRIFWIMYKLSLYYIINYINGDS